MSRATDRVDIYAYGILMFELFTGTRPVTGETIERLFSPDPERTIEAGNCCGRSRYRSPSCPWWRA